VRRPGHPAHRGGVALQLRRGLLRVVDLHGGGKVVGASGQRGLPAAGVPGQEVVGGALEQSQGHRAGAGAAQAGGQRGHPRSTRRPPRLPSRWPPGCRPG
jgi:hypothetical protein